LERLVIICDFDCFGISGLPTEAHAVLVIDADTVVTGAVASQRFQPIARRNGQLPQILHTIALIQLASCNRPKDRGAHLSRRPRVAAIEDVLGSFIEERSYHKSYYNSTHYKQTAVQLPPLIDQAQPSEEDGPGRPGNFDAKKAIVAGHSRYGKAALIAGAFHVYLTRAKSLIIFV
jgi:hypothetical protein